MALFIRLFLGSDVWPDLLWRKEATQEGGWKRRRRNANISSDCRTSRVDLHQCQSRCNQTLDIPDKQTSIEGDTKKSSSKHITFLIINLCTAAARKTERLMFTIFLGNCLTLVILFVKLLEPMKISYLIFVDKKLGTVFWLLYISRSYNKSRSTLFALNKFWSFMNYWKYSNRDKW